MIVREGNRDHIGSKGFELYRCHLLGLHVPEFWILTTECYRKFAHSDMDDDLLKKLSEILEMLGGKVVVRSSSVGEDLSDRSNAGLFRTILNVVSHQDLIKAVNEVWSSAGEEDMAVIIQKQLDPNVAGVLFTRNPLDGSNETIIEYIEGLCDSLVSGRSDPKRIKVPNDLDLSIEHINYPETGIDLGKLIETSRYLEKKFGYPLDIEWAYSEEELSILQVRPITNLPPPERIGFRTFSRVQAEQFYSGPVTPLFFSIFRTIYTEYYLAETMKDLGLGVNVGEDFLIRHKNFLYADTNIMEYALGAMPLKDGMDQIWETVPPDIRKELREGNKRSPIPIMMKVLSFILGHRDCWISRLDENFRTVVVPDILSKLHELDDPESLDDAHLWEHYSHLMEIVKVHVSSSKWGMILYSIPLMGAATNLLHKNDLVEYLPDLMSGFRNNRTMDASDEIRYLADMARSEKQILNVLTGDFSEYISYKEKIMEITGGELFIEYFENTLEIYGHRRISRDIHQPSWKDDPMIPFSMMRQLTLSEGPNDERSRRDSVLEKRNQANRKIMGSLPFRDKTAFRIISRYLVRYIEFRELQRFYLDMILAKMRELFIVIAKKMVDEGILNRVDDIFFLDVRSVFGKLPGTHSKGFKEEAWFNRASFENETGPPGRYLRNGVDFDSVPEKHEENEQYGGQKIIGQPVSSGIHTGRVLVVKVLDRNVKINKGDILVTRYIDPGQTHLFLLAGALILEVGGMLSHGAILARESNIPTVAGLKNATEILKDANNVVVNGTKGTVTILN